MLARTTLKSVISIITQSEVSLHRAAKGLVTHGSRRYSWRHVSALEQPTEDGLVELDMCLRSSCGRVRVSIEADGPWHFLINDRTQCEGSTLRRKLATERRGYIHLSIPYYEWSDSKTPSEKVTYLQTKLRPLLLSTLPPGPDTDALVEDLVGRKVDEPMLLSAPMRAALAHTTNHPDKRAGSNELEGKGEEGGEEGEEEEEEKGRGACVLRTPSEYHPPRLPSKANWQSRVAAVKCFQATEAGLTSVASFVPDNAPYLGLAAQLQRCGLLLETSLAAAYAAQPHVSMPSAVDTAPHSCQNLNDPRGLSYGPGASSGNGIVNQGAAWPALPPVEVLVALQPISASEVLPVYELQRQLHQQLHALQMAYREGEACFRFSAAQLKELDGVIQQLSTAISAVAWALRTNYQYQRWCWRDGMWQEQLPPSLKQ